MCSVPLQIAHTDEIQPDNLDFLQRLMADTSRQRLSHSSQQLQQRGGSPSPDDVAPTAPTHSARSSGTRSQEVLPPVPSSLHASSVHASSVQERRSATSQGSQVAPLGLSAPAWELSEEQLNAALARRGAVDGEYGIISAQVRGPIAPPAACFYIQRCVSRVSAVPLVFGAVLFVFSAELFVFSAVRMWRNFPFSTTNFQYSPEY